MTDVGFDVVFIAGPQGSGKGTQGKRLAARLGFFFWGMGETLRAIIKEGGPLAEACAAIDQGLLVSDDIIFEIVKEKFPLIPKGQGIVFEGLPRRITQAEFLLPILRESGRNRFVTILFDVPREESLQRLILRAATEKRKDDTPEGIDRRLRYYNELIDPMLEYLKNQSQFVMLDARPPIDEVTENVNKALKV